MVEKLFNKLSKRALDIILTINKILIIGTVAALVLCLSFAFANRFINPVYFRICFRICIPIFLMGLVLMALEFVVMTVLFLIDAVKRDGLLKLLKGFAVTYIPLVLVISVIRYAARRSLDWGVLVDCLIPISGVFFYHEIYRLIKGIESGEEHKDNL